MRIATNGIQLNVVDQGSGPLTLLFLHYFGGSVLAWQSVMNQLSGWYRCVAIDLRGHGDSDGPETGYSVDDMVSDVVSLLGVLAVQDFVLVGHSMSGKVALALAAGSPDRRRPAGLQSLLLVSPSPPVPEPIPDNDRLKMLKNYGQRSAAEETAETITAVSIPKVVREQIIADNLRTAKPAWDAWLEAGSKEDISARLSAVQVPVCILVGTADRALPPDVQTRLVLPYLKNATLETIEGAGHLLPWEVPDDVVAFILKKIVV